MASITELINALDYYMEVSGKKTVSLPESNKYLHSLGLLSDFDITQHQLRQYCKYELIPNAKQPAGKGTKWVISHSGVKSFILSEKLQTIIDSSQGERDVALFLSKHPNILRWAVCTTGGHCTYVIKEFPFGSKYKADYVVVTCYSGAWEVHIIELEPSDDSVITKAGVPSQRLNGAIAQLNDWKEYIEQYSAHFRKDLSDWCIKKDLLGDCKSVRIPVNGTGHYLKAPDTFIYMNYYIIIGNRNIVDDEKRRRINQINNADYRTKIFTYNRLVDVARNFDRYHNGEVGVLLTQTDEK